jgi:hypothetical protein
MAGRDRRSGEAGFATVWMLGLTTVALLLVALAADGARVLSAVSETGDTARAAARAGALGVDPVTRLLNPALADDEARAVVAARQMIPTAVVVSADGARIEVTVQTTIDLPLLTLLGVPTRTVSSTAAATVLEGIGPP